MYLTLLSGLGLEEGFFYVLFLIPYFDFLFVVLCSLFVLSYLRRRIYYSKFKTPGLGD